MQTSKDNDEDVSILEEDNPQIYAHLDNVLVHMINVMTDNISCLTHFPKDKTECKVDSLNIYFETLFHNKVYVVPQRSWGDRSDPDHSKCLLLGGRRLNLLTIIPKPKGSGGARAATAQIGPANERNKTK